MKDIAALPTNMALTLWDALPVYVGVALAVTLLARVWLPAGPYAWYRRRRHLLDLAGLLYLVAYFASLAIPYTALLLLAIVAAGGWRGTLPCRHFTNVPRLPLVSGFYEDTDAPPATPLRAIRAAFAETVTQLLVAGALAALINIYGPRLPDGPLWLAVPVAGAVTLGPNPGAAAIPAVAAASTSGMEWVGIVWLALAFGINCLQTLRSFGVNSPKTRSGIPNVRMGP